MGRWSLCPCVNVGNLDNRRQTLGGGTLSVGCDCCAARPIEQLKEHGTLTVIIPLSSGSPFRGQRCYWNTAGLAISMIEFGLDPSIDCVQWPPEGPPRERPAAPHAWPTKEHLYANTQKRSQMQTNTLLISLTDSYTLKSITKRTRDLWWEGAN